MTYWFIIHDLIAYEQYSDMIGCRVKKPGAHEPWFRNLVRKPYKGLRLEEGVSLLRRRPKSSTWRFPAYLLCALQILERHMDAKATQLDTQTSCLE